MVTWRSAPFFNREKGKGSDTGKVLVCSLVIIGAFWH